MVTRDGQGETLRVRVQPEIDWDAVADSFRQVAEALSSVSRALGTAADRLSALSGTGGQDLFRSCPSRDRGTPHPGHRWDTAGSDRVWCPGLEARDTGQDRLPVRKHCGQTAGHAGHAWSSGTCRWWCSGLDMSLFGEQPVPGHCGRDTEHAGHVWLEEYGTGTRSRECPGDSRVVPCYRADSGDSHPGHDWHQEGQIYRCPGTDGPRTRTHEDTPVVPCQDTGQHGEHLWGQQPDIHRCPGT